MTKNLCQGQNVCINADINYVVSWYTLVLPWAATGGRGKPLSVSYQGGVGTTKRWRYDDFQASGLANNLPTPNMLLSTLILLNTGHDFPPPTP